jgi:hypothetical protein
MRRGLCPNPAPGAYETHDARHASRMSSQVTALPLYGGMTFPLAIGAVVDGVPTTFQMPLSGHRSPVRAVVPMATAISLIPFSAGKQPAVVGRPRAVLGRQHHLKTVVNVPVRVRR